MRDVGVRKGGREGARERYIYIDREREYKSIKDIGIKKSEG